MRGSASRPRLKSWSKCAVSNNNGRPVPYHYNGATERPRDPRIQPLRRARRSVFRDVRYQPVRVCLELDVRTYRSDLWLVPRADRAHVHAVRDPAVDWNPTWRRIT